MTDSCVTAAIITFNSSGVIGGLLESLEDGFGDITYRIVVADNASSDDTVAVVRELAPDARIVETGRNGGYAAGINAAVDAYPGSTAILVLNPDVRLYPGCVPELMRGLSKPGTGIAVPRLFDAKGELIESMRREPTVLGALGEAVLGVRRAGRISRLGEVVSNPEEYERETIVAWAEGSTQLISAQCWDRCGPWDESFFMYAEEADFDLRAGDAGMATRYIPSARATHLEGGTSPALWSMLAVNRVRLFRRRNGRAKTGFFWFAALLREAIRAASGRETSRAAMFALLSRRRLLEPPGPHLLEARD